MNLLTALDESSNKQIKDETNSSPEVAHSIHGAIYPKNEEELSGHDASFWSKLRRGFQENPRGFERILFRLHLLRTHNHSDEMLHCILRFLTIGYEELGDVRYFNEFLWYGGLNTPFKNRCIVVFNRERQDGIHHRFPLEDTQEIWNQTKRIVAKQNKLFLEKSSKRIALLGPPHMMKDYYQALKKINVDAKIYFIPYYLKKFHSLVFANATVAKIYFALRGVLTPFEYLDFNQNDPQLQKTLKRDNRDIGIHCLGFIIKKNLIDSFREGILNDHIAPLPWIRGRSSVEFSLFYGLPVGSTVHFVDKGVDTGPIIRMYIYRTEKDRCTLKSIRENILRQARERILDSIAALEAHHPQPIANEESRGLRHYSISPDLTEYVEKRILPKRVQFESRKEIASPYDKS